MIIRNLVLIIPLLIFPIFLFADVPVYGCRLGLRIWRVPDYVYHSGSPYFLNDFSLDGTADGYTNNSGRCGTGSSTPCTIVNAVDGSVLNVPAYGSVGTLDYYSIDNCPLDDFVWFLFLSIAVFAFAYLRKQFVA